MLVHVTPHRENVKLSYCGQKKRRGTVINNLVYVAEMVFQLNNKVFHICPVCLEAVFPGFDLVEVEQTLDVWYKQFSTFDPNEFVRLTLGE